MVYGFEVEVDCALPSASLYYDLEPLRNYDIFDEFCIPINEQFSKYDWFPKICKNLSSYLPNRNINSLDMEKDHCIDLSYSLHDTVIKKVEQDEKEYKRIISSLEDVWKKTIATTSKKKCPPETFNLSIEDMKIRIKIYNYLNAYKKFSQAFGKSNDPCKTTYCGVIDDASKLYKGIHSNCSKQKSEQICPQIFRDFLNKDPITLTFSLKCKQGDELDRFTQEHGIITGRQKDAEDRSVLISRIDTEEKSLPPPDVVYGLEEPNNGFLVAFPICAIPLIFFILHRYTPFGSMISKQIGKLKGIGTKLDERKPKIVLDNFQYEELDTDKSIYNLEYHSM
ncbi:PIR Superfamily Protein [Plasmodium ovale wallikeri]|uniref:PIR Superfamily Protein n=1 Tax=Plasmodium ovale wallikeri TaxID=864142 RepID=A0A1A9AME9_PLAOA|nr:PIR Superfamily Protein [Plasmodium ovale wallikeri]SBT57587.1 PIR Superfamily Protein [Plasmodium ovale wallikeri]